MSKILIVGSGAFGSALTQVLVSNSHIVDVYGINENELNDLKENQKNKKYFHDQKLDLPINNTYLDINLALQNQYDFIIIAIPSFAIKNFVDNIKIFNLSKTIVVNAAKGLNLETKSSWCDYIKQNLKIKALVGLVGPSFAIDVFFKKPTVVNLVGNNSNALIKVKEEFENNWFKCILSKQFDAANYISCFKNALAIGCGIIYGLQNSNNSLVAFLTKGINEMQLILEKIFHKKVNPLEYFFIGDTILTCTDQKSRNFSFGLLIAQQGVQEALVNKQQTIEGLNNIKVIYEIIKTNQISAPLFQNLYKVIINALNPQDLFDKSFC
ncbi:NAD(P)H-dependent glycerol-3-phosphate dehydrogenase [Ureaplasma parvum]|uniref:NAD(P)H-dependent glycerol-3-phosphate dehydrogenase n=1 Tax=Ureaplasma parvum TaxID=134821 RepID=UPI000B4C433A|nr:NAD(P)H-dependent glycerol-3-phosphate dehydrogenase [Ureaplasma parvum]ASD24846.1 glycerol-3-phosphate dehydrogenase [Ureaplasma parvum]